MHFFSFSEIFHEKIMAFLKNIICGKIFFSKPIDMATLAGFTINLRSGPADDSVWSAEFY